jgi:Flp pilus assembly protein TadD
MHPKEVDLRLNLVESHINSRQYQLALQELLKIEGAADHLSRYHFDSGLIYLGLDELEKAREGFSRAVEVDDDFAEPGTTWARSRRPWGGTIRPRPPIARLSAS